MNDMLEEDFVVVALIGRYSFKSLGLGSRRRRRRVDNRMKRAQRMILVFFPLLFEGIYDISSESRALVFLVTKPRSSDRFHFPKRNSFETHLTCREDSVPRHASPKQ